MKAEILDIQGKKKADIELPIFFGRTIRKDIVKKFLDAKRRILMQQYRIGKDAGMKYSASGKLKHRRHKWKSTYGRGISRVPRKIMWRRGTQFFWIGATVSGTRGGRKAHAPQLKNLKRKINKKEAQIAFESALAATGDKKYILDKYSTIEKIEKNVPIIIDGKILSLKTKEFYNKIEKILGELYQIAIKKKKVRAGRGKMRDRKYKKSAGMLLVIGDEENAKISGIDIRKVSDLTIFDLAEGGLGRLTVYTEQAINNLKNPRKKMKEEKKESKEEEK